MAKHSDETTSNLFINMFESEEQYQNLETIPENELCLTPDDTPERLTELEAKVAANTSAIATKATKSTDFKTPITSTNKGITEADVATLDVVNDSVMDKTHTYSSDKISSIAVQTDVHNGKQALIQIVGNRTATATTDTRLYLYVVGQQNKWFVVNGTYDSALNITKYAPWGAGMLNWYRIYLVDQAFSNEVACKASPSSILRYWENYTVIDDLNQDNASTWSSQLISETINERISDEVSNYLPLTGGTLSGNLDFERPGSAAIQWNANNYTVAGYKWSWQYNNVYGDPDISLYFAAGTTKTSRHIWHKTSYEIGVANATLGSQDYPFAKIYAKTLLTYADDTTYTITVPEKTGTIALEEFDPTGLKVLKKTTIHEALEETDAALADLQDAVSILSTSVTLADTIGGDTVILLDELNAMEIDGRPSYKLPGATVFAPNGQQGIIHSVDTENQSATVKTVVTKRATGGGTNAGIKGDYFATWGWMEGVGGLPTIASGSNNITIPAGIIMMCPGSDGYITFSSPTTFVNELTEDFTVFYARNTDGTGATFLGSTDVVWSDTEPEPNGQTGFQAWKKSGSSNWQLRSNDTGNTWREVVGGPIADVHYTDGNVTRLDFDGYRQFNKQLYAFKEHSVIEFQAPTADNNYTWYRKYADGWVEQGGYRNTGTDATITITLPVEMADANYAPDIKRVTTGSAGTAANVNWSAPHSVTTTGFSIADFWGGTSVTVAWGWEVKGMAA